jgi:hypothetical protein
MKVGARADHLLGDLGPLGVDVAEAHDLDHIRVILDQVSSPVRAAAAGSHLRQPEAGLLRRARKRSDNRSQRGASSGDHIAAAEGRIPFEWHVSLLLTPSQRGQVQQRS